MVPLLLQTQHILPSLRRKRRFDGAFDVSARIDRRDFSIAPDKAFVEVVGFASRRGGVRQSQSSRIEFERIGREGRIELLVEHALA